MGDHTLFERIISEFHRSVHNQFRDPPSSTGFNPEIRVFPDQRTMWKTHPRLRDAYFVAYAPKQTDKKYLKYFQNENFSVMQLAGHAQYIGFIERHPTNNEVQIVLGAPNIEVIASREIVRDSTSGLDEHTYEILTFVNPFSQNPNHYDPEFPGKNKGLGQYILDPDLITVPQPLKTTPPQKTYDLARTGS